MHVSYQGGMNPYVGLEDYVSWAACGIERGKIMVERDYKKQTKEGIEFARKIEKKVDKVTGEIIYDDETVWFVPSATGRYCVKHLGKSLPAARYLFTKEVFTDEVLHALDENVIKKTFNIPDNIGAEEEDFGLGDE